MRSRRSRVLGAVVAAMSLFAAAEIASGSASAQSQTPSQRVIVVLKNQDRSQPATPGLIGQRRQTLRSIQAPVLNQLSSSHARSVHAYTTFNAVSATVTPSAASALKSDPSVAKVVPDQIIHLATPAATGSAAPAAGGATPLPGACPAPGKVQLNPQALQVMSVASDDPAAKTARSLGATGAGVKVAFIADGLDINNQDFIRADGQHVFVDYKDFSGAGTAAPTGGGEAFNDASSIAAQGLHVYDVSKYSALPLNRPCDIRVEGVAPGASLVGLDIFGDENEGFNSSLLQAIDYAVSVDHVNVLNESLGINNYPDDQGSLDLIKQANDNAVAAGTTVTVSTGDAGVTNTVGSPSSDPNVIAAGASTTFRTYAQDGYGGLRFPGITGWLDNNISSLSSGGFEQDGRTLDLVTPGESNWALCSTDDNMYGDCQSYAGNPSPVEDTGGTSESAPLTAGLAALVIQAYEGAHQGAVPSPALVKQLIVSNTDDIGAPADQQGAGLGDAYKAVLAARGYNAAGGGQTAQARAAGRTRSTRHPSRRRGHPAHRGHRHRGHHHPAPPPARSGAPATLVDSATQLNAVDAPGTPESLTDTLTNASGRWQRLRLSTRTLGAYQPVVTQTVNLSDSNPKFTDYAGDPDNYQTITFHVPGGQDRLNASAAFRGRDLSDLNSRVRFFLIDPSGRYAGDSRPQGNGNYGNFQVAYPAPGTWTAVIHSRDTAHGGTTGAVLFGASVARYQPFGTVSPSFVRLGPGQSAAVTLHTQTPTHPGDSSGSIVIASSGDGAVASAPTSIPVTLRSLIAAGDQSFTETLTGGNGRDSISGQEFYYQLPLASGAPELNATVTLADNPENPFGAYLIDPNGQMEGYATNMVPSAGNPTAQTNVIGAQVHVLDPAPGKWTLIVVFAPTVSGTALSEPFTVTVNQDPVAAGANGLPSSANTTLSAGHAYTYTATVKNTGTAPESFFPDARLPGSAPFQLGAVSGADTTEPLTFDANLPIYLVPTNSTAINLQASTTGTRAIQFDSQTASGDPDLASTFGTTAAASFAANPVAQGAWDIAPTEYGPGEAGPGEIEPVTTSAAVTTSPFDATVNSPTGDLEADSADPATSLANFKPITVGPGATATIPITITPVGASGTHVSGTLYLDDTAYFEFGSIQDDIVNFPQADQVAAIPYAYTIK